MGCFSPGSPFPRKERTSLDTEIKRFIAKKADLLFAHSWKPNGPPADTIEEDEGEAGEAGVALSAHRGVRGPCTTLAECLKTRRKIFVAAFRGCA